MPPVASMYAQTGREALSPERIRELDLGVLWQNASSSWSMVDCGSFGEEVGYDPELFSARAKDLSGRLGSETIALLAHTSTAYVELFVFRQGKLVRRLCQEDGGWKLEGKPLAWESKLFRGREEFDQDAPADDPTRRAVETKTLVGGSLEPRVQIEDVIEAAGVPEEFEAPPTPQLVVRANARALMIVWVVVGIAALALQGLFVERSSWKSALIFGITLLVWIPGLKWLQKQNGGRSIFR